MHNEKSPTPALADLDLPEIEQDWAKVDPSAAFHLIERHAGDWADAGRMMEAWRKANSSALAPSPQIAEVAELPPLPEKWVNFMRNLANLQPEVYTAHGLLTVTRAFCNTAADLLAAQPAEGAGQAGQVALSEGMTNEQMIRRAIAELRALAPQELRQAGQVAKGPDQQQIEWGNDLQGRLIDLSQDMTESEDARQVMAEAACLLASLTGHAVSQ